MGTQPESAGGENPSAVTASTSARELIDTLVAQSQDRGAVQEMMPPFDAISHARQIARTAHTGQADKSGHPYITHPARVAAAVVDDPDAVVVAWLHDVVEDTPVTLADLGRLFPARIVAAVDAVTRRGDETPADYYERVRKIPLAVTVKLADIADNADPDRLAQLDEPTRARLTRKYTKAREQLVLE